MSLHRVLWGTPIRSDDETIQAVESDETTQPSYSLNIFAKRGYHITEIASFVF
ncbi:MAG: hypothetical protein OCD01_05810 [Fibrobacterales bacterium]